MIPAAVFFLAALVLYLLCIIAILLLVITDSDDSPWFDRTMRALRVSVALGVISGFGFFLLWALR